MITAMATPSASNEQLLFNDIVDPVSCLPSRENFLPSYRIWSRLKADTPFESHDCSWFTLSEQNKFWQAKKLHDASSLVVAILI